MNTLQFIYKEYSRKLDEMGPLLAGECFECPFGSDDWTYDVKLEMSDFQTVFRLYFNQENYAQIRRLHTVEEIHNAVFALRERLSHFLNSFSNFRRIDKIQNVLELIKYWSELEFNKINALK